jgi:hypothetical protein
MIDWHLHHWLWEDMVSPRLQIDVLHIPRLFLIQFLLNKELNCSMEVLFQFTILRNWHWHRCVDGLWTMLVKDLFPGSSVMALEHILKLHKIVLPVNSLSAMDGHDHPLLN